ADLSGEVIWVTFFGEVAQKLITTEDGSTVEAKTLKGLYDTGEYDAYLSLLCSAKKKPGTFKIAAKRVANMKDPSYTVEGMELIAVRRGVSEGSTEPEMMMTTGSGEMENDDDSETLQP